MISRQHRFHGRGSLNYAYKQGRTVRGESISLRLVPSRQPDYRLAVVVSRKVSKSAVVRNKIRRRIYEVIRIEKKEANKPWPYDMIISVFDDRIATATSEEVRGIIVNLLQKARIIQSV